MKLYKEISRQCEVHWLMILVTAAILGACSESATQLERVRSGGELIVAVRNSPTTYFQGPDGPQGIEYDLAKGFADLLGVRLRIITADNLHNLLYMVSRGEVHLAAAGLTVTEQRKGTVRFGYPYQEVTQQIVYRIGTDRPRKVRDLVGKHLEIVADSSHAERLRELQSRVSAIEWSENPELSSEELLQLVWEQVIDYTVADSNEYALNLRFYPELRIGFDLTEPQQLAWAFPIDEDDSLYTASIDYFKKLDSSGELDRLKERYYGHVESLDYVGTRIYRRHINTRLPEYLDIFEQAGREYKLDWRLLAAIGYQESHWNPRARSPTGVKGIMMLTLPTAKHVGIDNRLDPKQSIMGGAFYFRNLLDRLPARIEEPDRIWMALAAYNVGLGHLEDARVITQKRGGNPDTWTDVKENLPLLGRKKWYRQTRYGYARGWEPLRYVENIRSYYEILLWTTKHADPPQEIPEVDIRSPAL